MEPSRLLLALLATVASLGAFLRLITRDRMDMDPVIRRRRRWVAIAAGVPLLILVTAVGAWATRPMLPGMFQYGGGEPYFIGEGGQSVGPGQVGCTPLSTLYDEGVMPLISVGHLSLVTPLTRERGWLWSTPIGFQVFRATHPPAHPKELWVKTGDDCYVEAHGYLG